MSRLEVVYHATFIVLNTTRNQVGHDGNQGTCKQQDARDVRQTADEERGLADGEDFVGVKVVEGVAVDKEIKRKNPSADAFFVAIVLPVVATELVQ